MSEKNHIVIWNRCLNIIKDNISSTAYMTWFEPIVPLQCEGKSLTIGVPSPFFYEYLEQQYADLLTKTLQKELGTGFDLMYKVLTDKTNDITVDLPGAKNSPSLPRAASQSVAANKAPVAPTVPTQELDPHLIPNYNFENFIKGNSNRLSRAVGESIAQDLSQTFNPLFLYGASGVGKTHLVNAIGTRIKQLHPEKRVLYISAHLFQVQYTDSVRSNHTNDFINFYQTIDVLIIDDVQEFAGLTKTQNTFFHIFNHLQQNQKLLILTSDRPPVSLQGMEDRLLTRFKWGLVAELELPDLALRRDILKNKIVRDGLTIPAEVIDFIAENVTDSVRELEGIVNSLLAYSILLKKEIDLDLAKRTVLKAVRYTVKPITVEDIVEKVCAYYSVEPQALFTKSRKREIVQVRQVAMFLSKKLTNESLSKIGKLIGGRDHATVLHSCKTVKNQLDVDKDLVADVQEIETTLRN